MNGKRSGPRARPLQAGCVRTAAGLVLKHTMSYRSTWAARRFPPRPASCGCAGRVIFGDTHRGGAPSGTHYSRACAEVEWLPSCFRFGVGVVYITAIIGLARRRPAVFPKHFEPFAPAELSLTEIAVGVRSVDTGESELRKGAVSRSAGLYGHRGPGGGLSMGRLSDGAPGREVATIVALCNDCCHGRV